MKKIIQIIACVAMVIAFTSCKERTTEVVQAPEPPTEASTDATAQPEAGTKQNTAEAAKKAIQDSLVKVNADIDSLRDKTATLESNVSDLAGKVGGLQEGSFDNVWKWVCHIAALLALLVAGAAACFIKGTWSDIDALEEELTKLKADQSKSQSAATAASNQKYSPTVQSKQQNLETKLEKLDARVNKLESQLKNNAQPQQQQPKSPFGKAKSAQPKAAQSRRTIYAAINSSNYFGEIFESQQENCVFAIELKSGNEELGLFTIISLDKIKSRNAWQDVVDYEGCSINDATRFETVMKGVCKKIDANTWEVTDHLKIKLYK